MNMMQYENDMQEEYYFSNDVMGKYNKHYAKGSNVVVIDPDVAEYFPNQEAVNEALRHLIAAFPASLCSPRIDNA